MKTKIQKKKLADICREIQKLEADTILLVIDQKVKKLYGKKIQVKGKKVLTWVAPQGEATKNFSSYQKCMEYFLSKGAHRFSHLVSIGGGATSDFAGFVAATLFRGIEWSVVPTTLLAMVDAGIGGKTGLNSSQAKNQIGAFHFPTHIWLDYHFLKTLSEEELLSGKGEILKYAFLSKELGKYLDTKGFSLDLIEACAELKLKLVKQDPFETKDQRIVLNLGHTFGHALEKLWKLPHGIAVACGIGEMLRLFDLDEEIELWHKRMRSLGFDLNMGRLTLNELKQVLKLVQKDKKKNSAETLTLVVPSAQKILLKEVSFKDFETNLKDLHGYS